MVLRLDSRIPMVWRNPVNLQFGVEPVRLVLREMTVADERMIAALSGGISRSGLSMIARSSGAGEAEVTRLLDAIGPVLERPAEETARPSIVVAGTGATSERIVAQLRHAGFEVESSTTVPERAGDFGIAVGHFVLDPRLHGLWLRRDLPHLPVIFGESAVTIGPIVEPGNGPCLYCLERYRSDADPAWPAIASQLWGRRGDAETPLVSNEVATIVTRLLTARLGAGVPGEAIQSRLDIATGEVTKRLVAAHPDCGCLAVDPALNPARRESGFATETGPDASPPPPTTIRVAPAPA